ncbi:MAG: PQQ-binding-like beta-propeller repeat protein [Armatimonadota bacterium]|jgi:outer membrane protein assembly factor BamB
MIRPRSFRRIAAPALLVAALLLLLQIAAWGATATGTVTLADTDPAQALAGVMVSDGVTNTVRTDADGVYTLPLAESARFVMVINPPGCEPTRDFYRALPEELPEQVAADFVLQPAQRPVDAPFTFVHITDSHGSSRLPTAERIINPINALIDRPVFVMETGDISSDDRGSDPVESYATLLEMPYFPVTGNHDVTRSRGMPFAGWEFETQFGPWYYAWYYGRYLFVGLPWSNSEGSLYEAAQWLESLLAMNADGEGAHVIVGFHHWDGLGRADSEQLQRFVDLFRDFEVRAVFMGHWHMARVYQAWGIPAYMSWNVAMGNRDLAAGGFRLITAEADGSLRSTFRTAGRNQDVTIASPADGATLARSPQPVVVNAFDTAYAVQSVTASLSDAAGGAALAEVELRASGGTSWVGELSPAADWPAELRLAVSVVDERGEAWPEAAVSFGLGAQPLAEIVPGADWPMVQNDPQRSGAAEGGMERELAKPIYPPLSLAWAHATGATFGFNSPIVVDGTVYVSLENNDEPFTPTPAVQALNAASGELLWTHELAGRVVRGGLAGNSEAICAMADDGMVFALDPATGRALWEQANLVPDPVWKELYNGSPVISGSTLIAGAGPGLAAYDVRDGSIIWETSVVSEGGRRWTQDPSPALAGDDLLLAWNSLHALSAADGEQRWEYEHSHMLTFTPTIADGKVLTILLPPDEDRFSRNRLLAAIDVATGEQLWTAPVTSRQRGIYTSPVVADGRVYAFDDEHLYALDLQTGEVLWQLELAAADVVTGSAAISGDHLYFVQSAGLVTAVNVETREVVWSHDLGVRVDSCPAISGNALYVAARDGTLYAFVGAP